MKTLSLSLFIFFFSSLTFQANAQVTAVMQARVQVIAGAGLSSISENLIDLNNVNTFGNFEAGSFSITTSPGSEVTVRIANTGQFKNSIGEELKLDKITAQKRSLESGEMFISVNGEISDTNNLNGHYAGSVTAVIEYY